MFKPSRSISNKKAGNQPGMHCLAEVSGFIASRSEVVTPDSVLLPGYWTSRFTSVVCCTLPLVAVMVSV